MGPRLVSRGNFQSRDATDGGSKLQWGRGLLAAEIVQAQRFRHRDNRFNGAAAC